VTVHALVVRLDALGDVLLAGPAVRALAAVSDRLTLLVGPQGEDAARLLPGVDGVLVWRCPWIDPSPEPLDPADVAEVVSAVAALEADRAVVLTSFHQSPLPTALLLRLAGVPWVAAESEDYPGSLLDLRHRPPGGDLPEAERMLSLARAAGGRLPVGDDGGLALRQPLPDVADLVPRAPYVVLHPGTSVPARAWAADRFAETAQLLQHDGWAVVVTGGPGEVGLTARVAGHGGTRLTDLGGLTTTAQLAAVLQGARAVVAGNTGPAHLAAATGTPVVSLFAPTVPVDRWAPYGVPTVVLGDQGAPCRGTRARDCPVPGHPCLTSVTPSDVVASVGKLADPVGREGAP